MSYPKIVRMERDNFMNIAGLHQQEQGHCHIMAFHCPQLLISQEQMTPGENMLYLEETGIAASCV